jgi:hypothetical protein
MRGVSLRDLHALRAFTRLVNVVVVYVGPSTNLDETIASHFETFGHLDTTHFEPPSMLSTSYEFASAHERRANLGLPSGYDLVCGYYLFLQGVLRGYHPGMPKSPEAADVIIQGFDALVSRFRQSPELLDWPIAPTARASAVAFAPGKRPEPATAPLELPAPLISPSFSAKLVAMYELGRDAGERDRAKK